MNSEAGDDAALPPDADIRLIALDLDDTLLGDDKRIATEDLAALRRARARGVRLVLATGRAWQSAREYARELGPDVPVIATGGAATYGGDGRVLDASRLPRDVAREIIAWADGEGIAVRVNSLEEAFYNRLPENSFWDPASDGYTLGPDERLQPDLARSLDFDPLQVVVPGREPARRAMRRFGYREGEIRMLGLPDRDAPLVMHVTHPLATKGIALARLCERLGVPREATLAFGDGINDLPMLAYAGVAVAARRAVPAAAYLADFRIAGDGGIASVLERMGIA